MAQRNRKRTPAEIRADRLRTGRPPKPARDKLSEKVMVYLTKAERAKLQAQAQEEGMTLAAMIMSPWRQKGA